MAKAHLFMKTYGRMVTAVADDGDHLAKTARGAVIYHPLQQRPGGALALMTGGR
jgi:hypothetical protein